MFGRCTSELLRVSRFPGDLRTIAFAGTIARAIELNRSPLIRGLPEERFQRLMRTCFPGVSLRNAAPVPTSTIADEFEDILSLLIEHCTPIDEAKDWLSHCVASAAMAEGHLWVEMGLPSRAVLSSLFALYFPVLASGNTGNMRWKKYLYRKLCERAGIHACRAPRCADCMDYAACFGVEETNVRTAAGEN